MLLFGLLCSTALLEMQGCGGFGGRKEGGYGGKSEKAASNPNPPAAPGPCKCIGNKAYNSSKKLFKKYPADAGTYCLDWDKEHNRRCEPEDDKDDEDWKPEWCQKIYCIVPKDCELDDTSKQYDGNYAGADRHNMDGYWSSKNCDASLYPGAGSSGTTAKP
jgi:hypothetical protein